MNITLELLTIAGIHILACMSPGPDFLLVSRAGLLGSRKMGLYTALGIALGLPVHIAYCLLGVGLIISKSIVLFSVIKLLGAGYLIYLGYKSLRAKQVVSESESGQILLKTPWQAVISGFLTNALNPKVSLFFLALFTQVIRPDTPIWAQGLYGLVMITNTLLWFTLVACVFSIPKFRDRFLKAGSVIDKVFGGLLIALGVKIAVSSK